MIPLFPDTGIIEGAGAAGAAIAFVILAGVLGALVREMIDNEGLKLPVIKEGVLNLGFLGALLVGGIAGFYLGDTLLGAFTAGLTASALLAGLITKPLMK